MRPSTRGGLPSLLRFAGMNLGSTHFPRGSHTTTLSTWSDSAITNSSAAALLSMLAGAQGMDVVTHVDSFMESFIPHPKPGMTQENFPAEDPLTTI